MPLLRENLSFSCLRCGECCEGPGGYVEVLPDDLERLCTFLSVDANTFGKKYLRRRSNGSLSLIDNASGDCIFLEDSECKVYSARPVQCSSWPWWPENLVSEEAWDKASDRCPGVKK